MSAGSLCGLLHNLLRTKRMKIPREEVLLCIPLAFFMAMSHISRELDVHAPVLFLTIPSHLICFALCVVWNKGISIIKEQPKDVWEPLETRGRMWRLFTVSALFALQTILGRLSRAYTPNRTDSWAVDIWNGFMPLMVALFQGSLFDETLLVSGGTSLAMVSACVIMLPFRAFESGPVANILALSSNACSAGALVISRHLLRDFGRNPTPVDLFLNVSVIVPFFFFIPIGFLEIPLILEYSQKEWRYVLVKIVLDTISMFGIHILLFQLLQESQILLVAVVYALGTSLAIVLTNPLYSIVGFFMVIMAFFVHLRLISL